MNKTASPDPAQPTNEVIDSQRDEQTATVPQYDTDPPSSPLESLGSDDFEGQLTPNGNDFIGLPLRSPSPTTPLSPSTPSPSPPAPAPSSDIDDERPSKRRRVSTPSAPGSGQKKKQISPPWKKITAEGPTSFIDNGRRKSGRINTIPLEFHPPSGKRMTRGALNSSPPSKNKYASTNGHAATPTPNGTAKSKTPSRKPSAPKPAPPPPKTSNRKSTANETKSTSRSMRKRSPSPSAQPTRQSTRTRRGRRSSIDDEAARTSAGSPNRTRIKLRVRATELPVVHPGQVSKRLRIGPNFEEYWEKAQALPVEDGGMYIPEEGPSYTDEMAQKDAQIVLRIEEAVEPGGILSQERCTLFVPEAEEEPPRQWAHADHMAKAVTNFRKLMVAEQQRHRAQAKKIAEACKDAWLRRQPKSTEELEAEARFVWIGRYRVVVKSMFGTWENVRYEINRRRIQEWEAEEQRRVKAALQEAVNLSEQKLQARRTQADSDISDEDDLDDDDNDDNEDDLDALDSDLENSQAMSVDADDDDSGNDDDDVMSSSEEEEAGDDHTGDAGDEKLTMEQLRAKYANLPELPPDEQAEKKLTNGVESEADSKVVATSPGEDTSDESVDMDDDMGSTDMDDSDDGSAAEEESEEEDGDEEPFGLLGMLFGKSELKKIKDEAPPDDKEPHESTAALVADGASPQAEASSNFRDDIVEDEDEDDEVSLIQHPGIFLDDDEMEVDTEVQATVPPGAGDQDEGVEIAASEKELTMPVQSPKSDEALVNGIDKEPTVTSVEAATNGIPEAVEYADTEMQDAPSKTAEAAMPSAPSTAAIVPTKHVTPDTDIVTVPPSREQSHSPPTSDTKPSDVDTMSLATPGAKDVVSRSASPNPNSQQTQIPFLLRGTLREYQHHGLDWLAGLYANNTNGILADEMGLGKTIQTISLLAHLACHHEVWGPHLVIVPTSVMLNWEMEFKKWCPGFKILSYYGTQEERKRKRQGWNNDDVWNVCITSYQLVIQDQQVFKRRRWHYMILDEAHNIKNFKSQRWQTLLGFNTRARLLLTGTPLQNNLTELWSLLFFLMPAENGVGGFADLQEFHDWFHKPESQILENGRETMDEEARAIISKLHKVLRPYLLRRLKADVEKQMPAKYEHVEFCRLSKRQRELYDGFLARTDTRETLSSGNYLSIINCLMQLRKVCNHPDLFVDRPIMTSFRMQKSVPAEYQVTDQFLHRSLLAVEPMSIVSLGVLNMIPTQHENMSNTTAERISQLSLHRVLMELREAQNTRAHLARTNLDPSTVESNIMYLDSLARWRRFEELQHSVYLNALRGQRRPIYGKRLIDFLTLGLDGRPRKPKPRVPNQILNWFAEDSDFLRAVIHPADERADAMQTIIQKFTCVTPAVITRDMNEVILGRKAAQAFTDEDLKLSAPVRWAPFMPKQPPIDPWHESRMRHSIQFPDKRLLQYDCGKLQALDKLLRKLQAGGHRALIFTQMTKVLDILEQFLNIHGHKYLRLDGQTKIEQRQILTDRFNHDPRILCFILSTRSGGLGINLTGADTVIFYDQDWNPAMDKQCQDRCHRIGQTRDVHIYRLVSEHTIEANILRKASQKQMLDDVVIQEGSFTTDYFNKLSVRDVLGTEGTDLVDDAANAAMDRLLGGGDGGASRTVAEDLKQAEDQEDVEAAKAAEKEIQDDDAEFNEKSGAPSGASSTRQGTPREDAAGQSSGGPGPSGLGRFSESVAPDEAVEIEHNAWGERIYNVDEYMLRTMAEQLKGTALDLPKDKKKSKKKGRDTRKR
ncbi:SNF2 family domain-containing protein [Colletotrichum scovillei]|uniref:DNA helicase n=1 Tax=Colletotrichum scovillei TaxID=1209932 RepID=A0A9P7RIX8_9PEZI|nr:SNF2 family domain-containing protein [Colletotrichum scovillei]KAF4778041.1 SNF2 family domain-containing protein [Colletotrichum scovillei]KAG7059478.1 Helicase SWR1 [Colletotrichum scovillei]KAG7078087.1 Helicase SWR1 [Colletotrichum scovillei]KAG7085210.1 Helicase SWR1 [Colletotrichum scovillei]